jgi:hypothetical protein
MIKHKKIDKMLMECYQKLYKNATPSANFKELFDNALVNEDGKKEIPFWNYFLSRESQDKIIDNILKKYKISSEWEKQSFKNTIYLGISPTFIEKIKN